MTPADLASLRRRLTDLASAQPSLRLLVLFGSRARVDSTEDSDWDFGFLGDVDVARLTADLERALPSDRVDVVDLARAGGLLRYRAARDGVAVWDPSGAAHERFVLEAVRFWLDAEHVLGRAYDDLLAGAVRVSS